MKLSIEKVTMEQNLTSNEYVFSGLTQASVTYLHCALLGTFWLTADGTHRIVYKNVYEFNVEVDAKLSGLFYEEH